MAKLDNNLKMKTLKALLTRLEADAAAVKASQRATTDGAFHSENRQEGSKDTRATEAGYLARGLATRVVQLQEAVAVLKVFKPRSYDATTPIALGALISIEDDDSGDQKLYFMVPVGGGLRLTVEGEQVVILTAKSPLGRAVLGQEEGDDFSFITPQGPRTLSILDVC